MVYEYKNQYRQFLNEIEEESSHIKDHNLALFQLFKDITIDLTNQDDIKFYTFFSRLAYLTAHFQLPSVFSFYAHRFRTIFEQNESLEGKEEIINRLGKNLNHYLIARFFENKNSFLEIDDSVKSFFESGKVKPKGSFPLIEAVMLAIDYEKKKLRCITDLFPEIELEIAFDTEGVNDLFTSNILAVESVFSLPLNINLIDCSLLKENELQVKAFILHPDYLVDVTAVAGYAPSNDSEKWLYVVNKFRERTFSKHLILGNVVNYLLDILVSNPKVSLIEIHRSIFELFPLEWAQSSNRELREIFENIQLHFNNLQRVVSEEFIQNTINLGKIYLEPSFYCRDYGLQGRLDLLHINQKESKADIIELKSGKPFKANSYGMSESHYAQTLLYDLLVSSAFDKKYSTSNYILYSQLPAQNLKYAPRLKQKQYELLKVRNDVMAMDFALAGDPEKVERINQHLKTESIGRVSGFMRKDLLAFETAYQLSTPLQQAYFNHFVSFISRELILAKTGIHGDSRANGLSALWVESPDEKEDRLSILNHLILLKNEADAPNPILRLGKSPYTARLSNFRKGDIAVLYPHQHEHRNILKHQIFKCTVLDITENDVLVRLRSSQFNNEIFVETSFWNLEEDVLTSSFNHMFRATFAFLREDSQKKELVLGMVRPAYNPQSADIELDDEMTAEQKSIVLRAFNTKDYFLIWGPPGTGKTSVVLKNLTKVLYKYSDEKILLLAYTNRAVDEICEALTVLRLEEEYLRIGSRYSVDPVFEDQLHEKKISDIHDRKGIIKLLNDHRIFVSTLASLLGKSELLDIVNIKTVIIDEASQILEPMLAGLLPRFERFILIGDHKQLPAVVVQPPDATQVKNQLLRDAGFTDLRISLFERLLSQCKKNGWENAWTLLSQQGRMHSDIMRASNELFYENKLKVIPGLRRLVSENILSLDHTAKGILARERMIFLPSDTDRKTNWKTNIHEAKLCAHLVSQLLELHGKTNPAFTVDQIGIITPYRAQIALIKEFLPVENVRVDTVERYQGSAKDIIILSLCLNKAGQMASIASISEEGIDRKLNVALTRAREQFILLGNEEILRTSPTYCRLLDLCTALKIGLE